MRYAVIYHNGGIYMDTDFLVQEDRNSWPPETSTRGMAGAFRPYKEGHITPGAC